MGKKSEYAGVSPLFHTQMSSERLKENNICLCCSWLVRTTPKDSNTQLHHIKGSNRAWEDGGQGKHSHCLKNKKYKE